MQYIYPYCSYQSVYRFIERMMCPCSSLLFSWMLCCEQTLVPSAAWDFGVGHA